MTLNPNRSPMTTNPPGQLDSTGAGTYNTQISSSMWSYVTLTAVADPASSPVWVIKINGATLMFGQGPTFKAGPFIVGAGETVELDVSNGFAGDTVTGTFWGVQGSMTDVAGVFASATVEAQNDPMRIGEWATAGTGNTSPNFSVPPSTQSLLIAVDVPANLTSLTVRVKLPATDPDASLGFAQLFNGVPPGGENTVVLPWLPIGSQVYLIASTSSPSAAVNFWVMASPLALPPSPVTSQEAAPSPASLTYGYSFGNGATVLTLPAGKMYKGTVWIACYAGSALGTARLQTDGNCVPPNKVLAAAAVQPNTGAMPVVPIPDVYVYSSAQTPGNLVVSTDNGIGCDAGALMRALY